LTLVVFAIVVVGGEATGGKFRKPFPAAVAAVAVFATLARVIPSLPAGAPRGGLDAGAAIGASLFFRDYVLPFELLSVLLLSAVLGALLLARKDRPE
jgi:NADH-quinone oxidoreductase subunit J